MEKGPLQVLVLFGIFGIILTGCDQLPIQQQVEIPATTPKQVTPSPSYDSIEKEEGQLLLGSFNIQIFGKTKASKVEVMNILDRIISQYDIIAIQEVRDASGEAVLELMEMLPEYEYRISERLGRSSSKEQYLVLWKPEIVRYVEDFQYEDIGDKFEREPYFARFEYGETTFTIINNHIKPDDAEIEIPLLSEVLENAENKWIHEEEWIILGDLNADCSYYNPLGKSAHLPEMHWVLPDNADTTVSNTDCAYDRFIVSEEVSDNIVAFGVDRFDLKYLLTQKEAKEVSDHYPIYMILDFI